MTYRDHLPQLDGDLFLTDGGIETVLIFHEGLDLPLFAAFDLLKDDAGEAALRAYYEPYAALAKERGLGFVLESPTWRASPRWAGEIGYGSDELDALNRRAIALLEEIRTAQGKDGAPIVISGCVGPQDDGYSPAAQLTADEAHHYHLTQVATFAETAADMVGALTLTYADEAIGIARAAADVGLPAAISFTVETDGRLPSGQPLGEAIEQVDQETGGGARLLHGQLRPPHALRGRAGGRRAVARARAGSARQRLDAQPRRAGRGRRARRGRSRRAGRRLPPAGREAPAAQRAGRLLRHRPPPRGGDPRRLAGALEATRSIRPVTHAVILISAEREALPVLGSRLAEVEGVAEAYSVTGEWDFVAVIRVVEQEQLADVVTNKLARLPGILDTYTMVAFEVFSQHDLDAMFSIGD